MVLNRRSFLAGAAVAVGATALSPKAAQAAVLGIPFFSQLDSKWKDIKLGFCSDTIGQKGCALTCMAMILKYRGADVDPAKLNTWLKDHGGFTNGCVLNWGVASRYVGTQWLNYKGKYTLPSLPDLSAQMANHTLIISESKRYAEHFVAIRGVTPDNSQGYYWDPADTTQTQRRIGDNFVYVGIGDRVFTY